MIDLREPAEFNYSLKIFNAFWTQMIDDNLSRIQLPINDVHKDHFQKNLSMNSK